MAVFLFIYHMCGFGLFFTWDCSVGVKVIETYSLEECLSRKATMEALVRGMRYKLKRSECVYVPE